LKVLISHPTANQNVRAAAIGMANANMLGAFHTSIASFKGTILNDISNFTPFAEIKRRSFDKALQPFTFSNPWREAGRMIASKAGFTKLTKHQTGFFSIDSVYKNQDKWVANSLTQMRDKLQAVYAYEDGALLSFKEAKKLGIECLYDLPIGYWRTARKLLEAERERWPEWIPTLTGFSDSEEKLKRKDEELRLADRIFVASTFTAKTLKDFSGNIAPIEVIPYGFPPVINNREFSSPSYSKPLKLLFVGGLSQRKGIADLFAAVEAIGHHVELTIVGRKATEECEALNKALAKHTWIHSLPNNEILKLMQRHDVLIFPSLFEGFGLVISEAMSQGTPVITTDRTAGPDLIKNGENGWLIKAGSTKAIQEAIEELLHRPADIAKVGRAAMETARVRPWKVYGDELAEAIERNGSGKLK